MKCQNCNADGATFVKRVPFPEGNGHVTLLVPQNLCPDCIRKFGKEYYASYQKCRLKVVR